MKAQELLEMCEATRKLRKEKVGTNIHITDVDTGEEVLVFDTTKLKTTQIPRSLNGIGIYDFEFVKDEPTKEEPKNLPEYIVKASYLFGNRMFLAWPKTERSTLGDSKKLYNEMSPEFSATSRNDVIAQMNRALGKDKYKVVSW